MLSTPEIMADLLLDDLQIISPEDLLLLEKIVWARNAQVIYEHLEGSEARLLYIPKGRSFITISSEETYLPRQRFSIAHELGHLELHRKELGSISCSSQAISPLEAGRENIEVQANQFASCLLLPSRFVSSPFENYPPSFVIAKEISSKFAVSLTAASSRYMQFASESLAFVISQGGQIIRFIPSQAFLDDDLFIDVGADLKDNTVADRLSRGITAKDDWHASPASSWLRGNHFMQGAEVKEWSSYSQRLDLTLSLIWVDNDLFDDW